MGSKRKLKRVTGVKDRQLVAHGIAVQAWIPKEVFMQFRKKYPRRGSVSKLIRRAFLLAVEDNHIHLPPAPIAEIKDTNDVLPELDSGERAEVETGTQENRKVLQGQDLWKEPGV